LTPGRGRLRSKLPSRDSVVKKDVRQISKRHADEKLCSSPAEIPVNRHVSAELIRCYRHFRGLWRVRNAADVTAAPACAKSAQNPDGI